MTHTLCSAPQQHIEMLWAAKLADATPSTGPHGLLVTHAQRHLLTVAAGSGGHAGLGRAACPAIQVDQAIPPPIRS